MSGRVRVTLSDGRRVTGFRKTLRRNPRLPQSPRADLRLVFDLPERLAFCTRSGEYGPATVDTDGKVTVQGIDRDFILRKAGEFLRNICHGLTLDPINAVLFAPAVPSVIPGGPARPGYQDGYQIVVTTGQPSVVLMRTAIKPVVVG